MSKEMIDEINNENNKKVIQIVEGFEKKPYSKSFQKQFDEGEIWFQSTGSYRQLYCLKRNNGFIGEVKGMWTLLYKGIYFSAVRDDKNLMIQCDRFENVEELFEWLNPILKEYTKTFKWNLYA